MKRLYTHKEYHDDKVIIEPAFPEEGFEVFSEIKLTKGGTLIGYWGEGWRCYLVSALPENSEIATISDRKIVVNLYSKVHNKDLVQYRR